MDWSVKVPSSVNAASQPSLSLSSAIWYAFRMICSLSIVDSSDVVARRVVELDVGGVEVLGQVCARAGARDEQDVRREVEQPGERELRRGRRQPCRQIGEHRVPQQLRARPPQRAERYERDVPSRAFVEDVPGSLVCQVEQG